MSDTTYNAVSDAAQFICEDKNGLVDVLGQYGEDAIYFLSKQAGGFDKLLIEWTDDAFGVVEFSVDIANGRVQSIVISGDGSTTLFAHWYEGLRKEPFFVTKINEALASR